MKLSIKYRQWTAALLLALYAFIATPGRLWHHHAAGTESVSFANRSADGHLTTAGATLTDNCEVCAHQYSAHYDDQYKIPVTVLTGKKRSSCFPLPPLPAAAGFPCSNKGPPSLV